MCGLCFARDRPIDRTCLRASIDLLLEVILNLHLAIPPSPLSSAETISELNSYVFTLLLHEYLHSLGYMDEGNVRRFVYEISKESFGDDHPAARFARDPPLPRIPPSELQPGTEEPELEIIKDFDRSSTSYIN